LQKVVTASEMQAIDRSAIEEFGIPGLVLMENAGLEAASPILLKAFDGKSCFTTFQ